MIKGLLSLLLGLLCFQTVRATPDTLLVYLKNSGQVVNNKDSADYFRFIMSPDTSVNKNLFRVYDFYFNGKPKMVATSLTGTRYLTLDGTSISYFPNGKRKSSIEYSNGRLSGNITNYYPNGEIYTILKIDKYDGAQLIEARDSTGKLLVTNGTGHLIVFDEDFKKVKEEGDIKKNKKDGEWRGMISDTANYVCTFRKDVLISGISYLKSGKQYKFKQFEVKPMYDGGMDNLFVFLKKNIQYPEFAKQHNITSIVRVSFIIETNGAITNVQLASGDVPCLNEEALRVIRMMPMWTPEMQYGIPTRVRYIIPVNFYNYTDKSNY